jgi:UDP-N-acetylmuramoyl-L-alanyl-D-glutamate--2,6-diaminopimelate ligase
MNAKSPMSSMRLNDLLARLNSVTYRVHGSTSDCFVTGITHDSRLIQTSWIFCCVAGERYDGHSFATTAVTNGATALLVDHVISEIPDHVPQIVVENVRSAMGWLAAALYGNPSQRMTIIGITGTNGKTTTANLLASILQHSGIQTEVVGTLQGRYTTPESPELQELLAGLVSAGKRAVSMEVSSHALSYGRVIGTTFAAGVFTNLGRDHLDFHRTQEAYFAAKARLFEPDLVAVGVVNADDPFGRELLDIGHVPMTAFGRDDARGVKVGIHGHEFTWSGTRIKVRIGGSMNLMNSLAAATTARELGINIADIASGLEAAEPVPGRFERIDEGQDFTVLVDYAHTPDGLSELLRSVRVLREVNRVILVFGCGGDRDKMKRPMMGEVAATLADKVIVTSDNPRSEDPEAIIASIVAGVPDHMRHRLLDTEPDRGRAIARAIGHAQAGDVVLITGKGHETTQTVGDEVLPFDDRVIARQILRSSK